MRLSSIRARTARPYLMSDWRMIQCGCRSNRCPNCFKQTGQLSVVIYVTSTRMENWKKSQHVQKMHRFEWKVTVW